MKKHVYTHTHAHKRVRGEVRRSLSLRAGAMSCQMGLAPRQLMSQSSLWSPSRAPWFTCLGCQVLPSPSLMQHGCPLNLFVSGSCGRLALAMTEHWATKQRRGTHARTLAHWPSTCMHMRTYSSYTHTRRIAGTEASALDPCRHAIRTINLYTLTYCICTQHSSGLLWSVLICSACCESRKEGT